jgi:hypothetical protein
VKLIHLCELINITRGEEKCAYGQSVLELHVHGDNGEVRMRRGKDEDRQGKDEEK